MPQSKVFYVSILQDVCAGATFWWLFSPFWTELWAKHSKLCWVWQESTPGSFAMVSRVLLESHGHWFSQIKAFEFQEFLSFLQLSKIFAHGRRFVRWIEHFTWLVIFFLIRMLDFISRTLLSVTVGHTPWPQGSLDFGDPPAKAPRGSWGKNKPSPQHETFSASVSLVSQHSFAAYSPGIPQTIWSTESIISPSPTLMGVVFMWKCCFFLPWLSYVRSRDYNMNMACHLALIISESSSFKNLIHQGLILVKE